MQGIKAICVLPYQSHVEQGFHFAVFAFCMRMPFDFSEQLLFFPAEYNAFAFLFSFHWLTSFLLLVRGESVTAATSALIMNALKRDVNKELLTFPAVADAGRGDCYLNSF